MLTTFTSSTFIQIPKKHSLIPKIGFIPILLLLVMFGQLKAHNNYSADLGIFAGPCNQVNALTNGDYDQLTASTNGISGFLCAGFINNEANLVDSDANNFASFNITAGASCSGTFIVEDLNTTYPAGSYAGFEIGSTGLLQGGVGASVTISTYLNGTLQESNELINSLAGVNSSLVDGNGRVKIGYITTLDWDEVRIEYETFLGTLFTAQVYSAVIQEFCLPSAALECNEYTSLTNTEYPVIINSDNTGISGLACVGCSVNNAENVIDADVNNAAGITLAASVGVSGSVSVEDALQTYDAGTFAGFEISNANLSNVDLLDAITITTYNDGVQQETASAADLIGVNSNLLNGAGRNIAGFITTLPYDQIEIEVLNIVGLLNTTLVHRAVIHKYCPPSTPPVCNEYTDLINPEHPVIINSANTGVDGLACVGCSVNNAGNVIDPDVDNTASITLIASVGANASLAVENILETYDAGTFAGFEISNADLANADLFNAITITTYNDGVLQETSSSSDLVGVNSNLLNGAGRNITGFVTTLPYDQIEIEVANPLGLLNTTLIYRAVIQKFCLPSNPLECNEYTDLTKTEYPVIINSDNTGIDGIACAGCSVNNPENVIDSDVNNTANITLAATVGSLGSVAVEDVLQTYDAGTFAGFEISNADLTNADLFNAIRIMTYNDGALQEMSTASNLIAVGSSLLNGTGRSITGFVTTLPYDQIEIEVANPLGLLNTTFIYRSVVKKLCEGTANCLGETQLVSPDFPVVTNHINTGITGVCALCSVNDIDHITDTDTDNAAAIVLTGGVVASGSISIEDVITTYPAGMFAGFDIFNPALADLSLLGGITITTYLDGVQQETTAGNLLSLSLISGSRQLVGFNTSLPFDQVQITVSNLASADLGTTLVYATVVQSGDIDEDGIGDICDPIDSRALAVDDFNNTAFNTPVSGDVSINDSDNMTFTLDGPNGGMDPADGTVTMDADGNYVFTPAPGFEGETSFSYEACTEDAPVSCQTATVHLEVFPPISSDGQPVIINVDANQVENNSTATGNVLSNDVDPDEGVLTVSSPVTNQVVSGTDEEGNPVANAGTLTLAPDGSYTFVPTPGFVGTVSYPYTACNDEPTPDCGSSSLQLDVLPDTGNTTYANDDTVLTDAGITTSGNLLDNDSDNDGNTQTVSSYVFDSTGDMTMNDNGTVGGSTTIGGTDENGTYVPNAGTLEINSDGTYSFTPAPGFSGNAVAAYTVCDDHPTDPVCDDASLTFTVLDVNRDYSDAPLGYSDAWHRVLSDSNNDNVLDGSNNVWLGTNTDFETTAIPSPSADFDDYDDAMSFGTNPGEFPLAIAPSQNFDLTVTLNGVANNDEVFYGLWIDWNDDGTYDDFYNGSGIIDGSSPLDVTVNITVPAGVDGEYPVNVRLRADDDAFASGDFSGSRTNGEAEDHQATVALPVELISFSGRAKDCATQLSWTSGSEENFDRYEIEWNNGNKDWKTIDIVEGSGGANLEHYEYLHEKTSESNYYRLKMVDNDGSYEYSNIINVAADCASITKLVLYPNPLREASNIVSVEFLSAIETEERLVVLDMLGRTVMSMDISINNSWNTFNVNVQQLQKGMYVLRMENSQISKTFTIIE